MTAHSAPDHSHALEPGAAAESSMSPAQARRLDELRRAHPDWTLTPAYVHGISGMVEVRVRQPGCPMRVIGLTATGGEAQHRLTADAPDAAA